MVLIALAIGAAIAGSSSNESTMKNKTTTNVANNFMQSMSTDISNRNEAELDMTQTLTFRAPFASMKNCNLTIEQNQKGTLRATMDAMADLSETQKATLASDISNAQSQALEQANAGLNLPTENKSDVENEITTNITNNLSTAIDKTFENMNFAKGSTTQDATIDLYGMQCEGSNIVINQNQALEVVAENLAETIIDSVQDGEAVAKVKNEQTQSVKQKNEGVGASGSGSISSGISSSVLIIGGMAAFPKIKEMMDENEGSATDTPTDGGGDGGINLPLIIGLVVVALVIITIIIVLKIIYTPEYPCPSEEDCSKAWDEIKAASPRVPSELLRKYHNCRIRHRHKSTEKPEKFRPHCESYCAYVDRERNTPGFPSNPLEFFFCFKGLGGGDDDKTGSDDTGGGSDDTGGGSDDTGGGSDDTGGGSDDTGGGSGDSQTLSANTDISNTQTQESFVNYKTKPLPEGYGNYY